MNNIHLILQGKGGVGKSFISSLISQFLIQKYNNVLCFDTDPVNNTFSSYASLNVDMINIMEHDKINTRAFDGLIEKLIEHNGNSVVDNGASTFIPLSSYMIENNLAEFLKEHDKNIMIHTVLTGGQALDDTLIGLKTLCETQKLVDIIVWENEFFGEIKKENKSFKESKIYDKYKNRIKGIVNIKKQNEDTFGKDISFMTSNKLLFDEVLNSDLGLMPKQRLKNFQKSIFEQLEKIDL